MSLPAWRTGYGTTADAVPAPPPCTIRGAGHGRRNVDAELVLKLANLLGYREDAEALASLAETIRQAFCREFVNLETGEMLSDSQTALSCVLYQRMVPDTLRPILFERLVAQVEVMERHLDCGILAARYKLIPKRDKPLGLEIHLFQNLFLAEGSIGNPACRTANTTGTCAWKHNQGNGCMDFTSIRQAEEEALLRDGKGGEDSADL